MSRKKPAKVAGPDSNPPYSHDGKTSDERNAENTIAIIDSALKALPDLWFEVRIGIIEGYLPLYAATARPPLHKVRPQVDRRIPVVPPHIRRAG